jgi:hypothetical protein
LTTCFRLPRPSYRTRSARCAPNDFSSALRETNGLVGQDRIACPPVCMAQSISIVDPDGYALTSDNLCRYGPRSAGVKREHISEIIPLRIAYSCRFARWSPGTITR